MSRLDRREVVTLSDYEMSGEPEGPVPRTIETPNGIREIDLITVPISFVFQGESFTSTDWLSLVDGVMHWLGECR